MNDVLDLPAERDLPPDAARKMRASLLGTVGQRPARTPLLRIAVAGVALLVVASGAAAVWSGPDDRDVRTLAMGPGELSPTLRDAAEQCLRWHEHPREPAEGEERVPISLTDLAVATEQGSRAQVLFMNDDGYLTCGVQAAGGQVKEPSGGLSAGRWSHGDWLPGPVQRLLLASTEDDGGDVSVSGRVSRRVNRLVLDHGDGRTTVARLSGGAFGLVTTGADLQAGDRPQLVSYDDRGVEVDRRPLFRAEEQLDRCYVTPSGTLVHGRPAANCLPAEAWGR